MTMQFVTRLAYLKNKTLRFSTLSVLFLLMQSCSSAPSSLNYYLLHSTDSVPLTQNSVQRTLVLDKITLPEYLKHKGLVYQTSDTSLHISTAHLWAEPMDEGLSKVLSSALADKQILLQRGDQLSDEEATHITLHIDDFISTYKGDVVFSGQYTVSSVQKGTSIHSFKFKAPIENDGFSSSIQAMRNTIAQLAQHLSQTF